jgi:hypothetical protein
MNTTTDNHQATMALIIDGFIKGHPEQLEYNCFLEKVKTLYASEDYFSCVSTVLVQLELDTCLAQRLKVALHRNRSGHAT